MAGYRNPAPGGGPGGIPAVNVRTYIFTEDIEVPRDGSLFLSAGKASTSSAPIGMNKAFKLLGASVRVNRPDSSNGFDFRIKVDGTTQETIALATSLALMGIDAVVPGFGIDDIVQDVSTTRVTCCIQDDH